MPTNGLALVGFLPQPAALQFLRTVCLPADPSDGALSAQWKAARANLGGVIPKAGQPEILPMDAAAQPYLDALVQVEWVDQALNSPNAIAGSEFKMVEIDPLLAYQIHVCKDRSQHHCSILAKPPSLQQLLELCLPVELPSGEYHAARGPQSVVITSRSLNFRSSFAGVDGNVAGMAFAWALPLVQVVRLRGRCYLHNGFHRVYGARLCGATHVPCAFRDVDDERQAGITPPGTFDMTILEGPDPPTLAHFNQGRAHPVKLRESRRVLHVSWADYIVFDE